MTETVLIRSARNFSTRAAGMPNILDLNTELIGLWPASELWGTPAGLTEGAPVAGFQGLGMAGWRNLDSRQSSARVWDWPVFAVSATPNGRPALRFGGNAQIGNSGIGTIDAPFLASFVFRSAWPQSGSYNRIFTNSGATNGPSLTPVSGSPGSLLLRGHLSATPTVTLTVPNGGWTSLIIQFNGAATRVKSGAAAPVLAPLAAGILTGIRIGGANNAAPGFTGDIAEIRFERGLYSDTDIEARRALMVFDYGLTL